MNSKFESTFAPGDFVVRRYSNLLMPPDEHVWNEQELQVITVLFDRTHIITYNCENIRTGARQFYTEDMLTRVNNEP
jgi:hypothetical protein